ncbi:kinase-like protein [Paxillus ammoniavirescens]|nr:kinase-like protein [Paxillus ammoniavirescens]
MYPTAYGRWTDIWKCALKQDSQSHEVAVQSIRSYDLDDHDIRQRNKKLRQELEVRARVEHENILPLLGVATSFGRFTALVECLLLRDRLELLRDVAAGLRYLHSCSIVQEDLTGSNILISASGRAQLSISNSNIIMELLGTSYSPMNGAIRWAAPETITTHDDQSSAWVPNEQSVMYSFGSIILQVFSGEVPYADLQRDLQVMLALSTGMKPSRPQMPWMTDRIWEFIQRCWTTIELGTKRPSAEEALRFIQGELNLL